MKLLATTSLAAILLVGGIAEIHAADISDGDWSGAYVGVHGGFILPSVSNGWCGTTEEVVENVRTCKPAESDQSEASMLMGVRGGYNHDFGGVVLGLEADYAYSLLDNVTAYGELTSYDDTTPDSHLDDSNVSSFTVDGLASVRARAGLAMGDFMVNLNGGVGYVSAEFAASTSSTDLYSRVEASQFVPVLGAGMEWRATESVSLRLDASYFFGFDSYNVENLGDGGYDCGDEDCAVNTDNEFQIDNLMTVTTGVSYNF